MKPSPKSLLWSVALAASGGLLWSCGPGEFGVGAVGAEPEDEGSVEGALAAPNGLQVNGIHANGVWINGLPLNGLNGNGLNSNGLNSNGISLNGLPLNGMYVNGLSTNGTSLNGIGANGIPLNGLPFNGVYVNGLPLNGLNGNGLNGNGLPLNGLYANGAPLSGPFVNGQPVNGVSLNGLSLNGLFVNAGPTNTRPASGAFALNGLYVNGVPLSGVKLHGLRVNGTTASTAIKIGNMNGQAVNLTAAQETQLKQVLPVLVACALRSGESLTIYGSNGAASTYSGVHGLAPEWKSVTSGLWPGNPSAVDGDERVRWCAEHYRLLDANDQVYPGVALNLQQVANLKTLLKYAVECALRPDQSVTLTFPTSSGKESLVFRGAMGLGQGWATGALNLTGQKAVSACIAARTNAAGAQVRISLRGPASFTYLATSAVEREQFSHSEGAFWGNLFSPQPTMSVCKEQAGGPAGRLCTQDSGCGFTYRHPSCEEVCSGKDSAGNWTGCDGETVVLGTYLLMGSTVGGGDLHNCVRRRDGRLACWGSDEDYARGAAPIGDGLIHDVGSPTTGFNSWAGANGGMCATREDGSAWCWGNSNYGILGDGDLSSHHVTAPRLVAGMTLSGGGGAKVPGAAKVTHSSSIGCVVMMNGSLYCWGANWEGGLATGDTTHRATPVLMPISDVVDVSTGEDHVCALKMNGTLWCWGGDDQGQVGIGDGGRVFSPTQVTALGSEVVDVECGGYFTCATTSDRSLWCWGRNGDGEVGIGSTASSVRAPTKVGSLINQVAKVDAFWEHACAVKLDGTVWCWGDNGSYQLGDGTTTDRRTPVKISLPGPAADVGKLWLGGWTLLRDGRIYSWGKNIAAEVGDGTTRIRSVPVRTTQPVKPGDGLCELGESYLTEPQDCAAP